MKQSNWHINTKKLMKMSFGLLESLNISYSAKSFKLPFVVNYIVQKKLRWFLNVLSKNSNLSLKLSEVKSEIEKLNGQKKYITLTDSHMKFFKTRLNSIQYCIKKSKNEIPSKIKMIGGIKLALIAIWKSRQKMKLLRFFNHWRDDSMLAMMNWMAYHTQTQQYSQLSQQLRLMNILNENGKLCYYSKFFNAIETVDNSKRIEKAKGLIIVINGVERRKFRLQKYFNKWCIKVSDNNKLIKLMETKLQLIKINEIYKAKRKNCCSMLFTEIINEGIIRKNKTNFSLMKLKVI